MSKNDQIDKNRDINQHFLLCPKHGSRGKPITKDVLISAYIAEGLSAKEIANRYKLSIDHVKQIIKNEKLPTLRKAYILNGIEKIQNQQLKQAHELLDLENKFKSLRIMQLQEKLEEYAAYYARFGDLKKRNPVTGEVLTDLDGMSILIKIPNIANEIKSLKESVTVSEGMRKILSQLESIVNAGSSIKENEKPDIIDVNDYKDLFERKEE